MPDPDDDDELEKEEQKEFEARFNKVFHKAAAAREAKFKKDLVKDLDTSFSTKFEEFGKKIEETLAKAVPAEGTPKEGAAPAGGGKISPEIDAQLKQSMRDAKEAKEAMEKYRKEAEEARIKNQRGEERAELTKLLGPRVKPAMLDIAVDQLHKNVVRDPESGAILYKNADGDHVKLDEAITTWAKSDVGKEFAPARPAGGTGGSGGRGDAPTKPGTMSADALADIVVPTGR